MSCSISEAKTNLSQYVNGLREGDRIILCKLNRPIAEVRLLPQKGGGQPRRLGLPKGEFTVPDRYLSARRKSVGFDFLAIEEPETCLVHALPPHHRDPFDRMLVAQANCYGLVIATNDPLIQRYRADVLVIAAERWQGEAWRVKREDFQIPVPGPPPSPRMWIWRPRCWADLGSVTLRTPSRNSASMRFSSTPPGRLIERRKLP